MIHRTTVPNTNNPVCFFILSAAPVDSYWRWALQETMIARCGHLVIMDVSVLWTFG